MEIESKRPVTVSIALIVLWGQLVLCLTNTLGVSANLGWSDVCLFVLCFPLMFVLRGLGKGANWTRLIYLGVLSLWVTRAAFAVGDALDLMRQIASLDAHLANPSLAETRTVESGPFTIVTCEACGFPPRNYMEWSIAADILIVTQAISLTMAILLLFTPSANRWFWKTERVPETTHGSSTASQ
jgi:hypothetical protein